MTSSRWEGGRGVKGEDRGELEDKVILNMGKKIKVRIGFAWIELNILFHPTFNSFYKTYTL